MRVHLCVVGRPRAGGVGEAIREYEARASRYWPLDAHEVREESARSASADVVRHREGERILSCLPAAAVIVACDERGASWTSAHFAQWMQRHRDDARDVAFLIGGAYGLAPNVRQRASVSLALAPWTLPHELARLVLAEQLYRAGTIVRGEPYHKP